MKSVQKLRRASTYSCAYIVLFLSYNRNIDVSAFSLLIFEEEVMLLNKDLGIDALSILKKSLSKVIVHRYSVKAFERGTIIKSIYKICQKL